MTEPFVLRGETIDLHQLLKASGLCGSGGEAKQVIQAGLVKVDGQVEIRKACKIRRGQQVAFNGELIKVN
jgi:ribosome-associated protein